MEIILSYPDPKIYLKNREILLKKLKRFSRNSLRKIHQKNLRSLFLI